MLRPPPPPRPLPTTTPQSARNLPARGRVPPRVPIFAGLLFSFLAASPNRSMPIHTYPPPAFYSILPGVVRSEISAPTWGCHHAPPFYRSRWLAWRLRHSPGARTIRRAGAPHRGHGSATDTNPPIVRGPYRCPDHPAAPINILRAPRQLCPFAGAFRHAPPAVLSRLGPDALCFQTWVGFGQTTLLRF